MHSYPPSHSGRGMKQRALKKRRELIRSAPVPLLEREEGGNEGGLELAVWCEVHNNEKPANQNSACETKTAKLKVVLMLLQVSTQKIRLRSFGRPRTRAG